MSTAQIVMENLNNFQDFENYVDDHDMCPGSQRTTFLAEIADLFDVSAKVTADIYDNLVDEGLFETVGWGTQAVLTPKGLEVWI